MFSPRSSFTSPRTPHHEAAPPSVSRRKASLTKSTEEHNRVLWRLVQYAAEEWCYFSVALVLMLGEALCSLAMPLMLENMIETATQAHRCPLGPSTAYPFPTVERSQLADRSGGGQAPKLCRQELVAEDGV
jgi:hypothetical protein